MAFDKRDLELGLRDDLARIVASKMSGVKNPIPEESDYMITDRLSDVLDRFIDDYINSPVGRKEDAAYTANSNNSS